MDFSNVNQSDKQAETEMVWKCRFHTRTHAPALQGLFQLWGSSRWKLHPDDSGGQSQIVTQIFLYQQLSLTPLRKVSVGFGWVVLTADTSGLLENFLAALTSLTEFPPLRGLSWLNLPPHPLLTVFPSSPSFIPLFSLVSRSRRAARPSPLPAASSLGRVQEGLKRDPEVLLHLGGSWRLGLFLRGETKYVLMVSSGWNVS